MSPLQAGQEGSGRKRVPVVRWPQGAGGGRLWGRQDVKVAQSSNLLDRPLLQSRMELPRGLSGKESACQCKRHRFDPWFGKIPSRRKSQPTPVFLPGKSHGQRSLEGYSPWGRERVRYD